MAAVTRTLNPIHFEDLDPRRFEDLIRQLIYDFKPWRRLEATGRAGSDHGFDARGYEIRQQGDDVVVAEDDEAEAVDPAGPSEDRLWLVQCKREGTIGPAKMRAHLRQIRIDASTPVYGVVFAASCNFSKSTRDVLADWCRTNSVSEWHLWGKAELEDRLLQPKNDSILFAYFGISLVIRQRSRVSAVRRDIATKRKLTKLLADLHRNNVLLRDIEDERYPYLYDGQPAHRWCVKEVKRVVAQGLVLGHGIQQAWLSPDRLQWDAALAAKGARLDNFEDKWLAESDAQAKLEETASNSWEALPDEEKAWVYTEILVPFARIVLVDDIGDDQFRGPHLFLSGWRETLLGRVWLESVHQHSDKLGIEAGVIASAQRIARFPEEVRIRPSRHMYL